MNVKTAIETEMKLIQKISLQKDSDGIQIQPNIFKRGLNISQLATRQAVEIAMTPLFKNMLAKHDPKIKRLTINDKETLSEKRVIDWMVKITQDYSHSKIQELEYDITKDWADEWNYWVDCKNNIKENLRDIVQGQERERLATVLKYLKPNSGRFNYYEWKQAVDFVLSQLPRVKASDQIVEINQPFLSKHTNVSYPFWFNDRTRDKKTKKTYGEITMDIAKRTNIDDIFKYNFTTLYGRNQRGKGRHILAISRIPNLILNQLEASEISSYKVRSPIFAGYNNVNVLKEKMITMYNQLSNYKENIIVYNIDQSKFDLHVNSELLKLVGAISVLKATDARSKKLARYRSALMLSTQLISPINTSRTTKIYGRIFSGFIDTNRCGGLINALITSKVQYEIDQEISKKIHYTVETPMLVMGDDNLTFIPKINGSIRNSLDEVTSKMKTLGFEINQDKGEYGMFFLQHRLIKNYRTISNDTRGHNDFRIAYPFTRVVRSMLFKESGKGLGEYGWTLAYWMQLSKLIELPDILGEVLKFLMPYDKYKFHLYTPIKQIKKGVALEDANATKNNKRGKTNTIKSTAQILFDGDPQKNHLFQETDISTDIEFNFDYLSDLQARLRKAYES